MDLEILIITYNRARKLETTLGYFVGSVLQNHSITIFDNCSTDDTGGVWQKFKTDLPTLQYIKNKINIGGDANILRAVEHSKSEYTWVVCDDDELDLSHFEDVLERVKEKKLNLIHVGGHQQRRWAFGGRIETPKSLIEEGYPYFKFCSFLPTNIFRTRLFQEKYLIAGYRSIAHSYPHMPYLIDRYLLNEQIYIAEKQCVTASLGEQSYSGDDWMLWWMRTSELMQTKADVRLVFIDQWKNIDDFDAGKTRAVRALQRFIEQRPGKRSAVNYYLRNYFGTVDKIHMTLYGWKRNLDTLIRK